MKIVFVLPDMPGGGSERVVAMLANEYVKQGYQIAILLFAGNRTAYALDERVEVVIAGEESSGDPFIRLKRLFKMRQYYKENKNCYIFSFCVMGTVFSVLAAWGIPHRLLVSERNDPTRIKHQKLRNWAYRKAEKLVFQTEDMKKCFPEDIQAKSEVIPNPVGTEMPEPFEGIRKKWIVSAARLKPQKNHKLLIDAFADFSEDYPDYELHIFGVGELEGDLKQQVKAIKLEHRIWFHGFSPNVKEEIRDSAMFVLSSNYEGISNSMIEALAMGVPVISTDCPVGGSAAYIQNGVNGILTPVGDRKALAGAMKKMADDPQWAETLGENAVKIKENYSLSRISQRFLEAAGIDQTGMKNNEDLDR